MPEEIFVKEKNTISKKYTIDDVSNSLLLNEKGKIDGLIEGKLQIEKRGNFIVKARSTIKFVFQILIGILIYSMVLSTLLILKMETSSYIHVLMILVSFSIIGVIMSITLYIFYPLIAPRVFDFHHDVFYTKPLSFYIYLIFWDSIRIISLQQIHAIQIIHTEEWVRERLKTIDQTNIILENGERIPLIIRKNGSISQTKEDAQRIATRLVIPVWDMSIVETT